LPAGPARPDRPDGSGARQGGPVMLPPGAETAGTGRHRPAARWSSRQAAEVTQRACLALPAAGRAADGHGIFARGDRLAVSAGLPQGDADVAERLAPRLVAAQRADTGCRPMCRDALIRPPQILHDQAEAV
jgi:hypothetical protein